MPWTPLAGNVAISLGWIGLLGLVAGCPRGQIGEIEGAMSAEELVAFYSPKRIEIKQFTKVRSFDKDPIPDGIAVSLEALDQAGDPIKVFGDFLFELYAYQPATMNHRGERLQIWQQPVRREDHEHFWNKPTRSYEFFLSWEGEALAPDKKYILTASFESGPGTVRLFDEYEFEFRFDPESIAEQMAQEGS